MALKVPQRVGIIDRRYQTPILHCRGAPSLDITVNVVSDLETFTFLLSALKKCTL